MEAVYRFNRACVSLTGVRGKRVSLKTPAFKRLAG
jgi:hypothetical protein